MSFSALVLESAVYPKILLSLFGEWYLETRICGLAVLIAPGVSAASGSFQWTEPGNVVC